LIDEMIVTIDEYIDMLEQLKKELLSGRATLNVDVEVTNIEQSSRFSALEIDNEYIKRELVAISIGFGLGCVETEKNNLIDSMLETYENPFRYYSN